MTAEPGSDLERFAAGLVSLQRAWQAFVADPPPWVHQTAMLIHGLSRMAADFQEKAAPRIAAALDAIRPFAEALETLQREKEKADLLEAAGWLPHATSPFHLIERTMSVEDVGAVAEAHYRERWDDVRGALLAMVAVHDVDDEARATFHEAVQAHGHGLHRIAPRLLFPDLERIARRDLLGRDLGSFASLKELRRQVERLPLSRVLPGGLASYALYKRLAEHLYEEVKSPEQLERVRADPVPNRHAAIHGLVAYGSAQNSLNAIVMAEYILGLVGTLKAMARLPPDEAT